MNQDRRGEVVYDCTKWLNGLSLGKMPSDDGVHVNSFLGINISTLFILKGDDIKDGVDFSDSRVLQYVENEIDRKFQQLVESGMGFDPEWAKDECQTNWDGAVQEQGLEEVMRWGEYGELSAYSAFVGTVFSMTPSGKYYTPFANSNVNLLEALMDAVWYDAYEEVLDKHGFYLANGEGDPCDLFIVGSVNPNIDQE